MMNISPDDTTLKLLSAFTVFSLLLEKIQARFSDPSPYKCIFLFFIYVI